MNLLHVLLMAPQTGAQGGGGIQQILFFALIIGVFYFFMIRPQTKKAKAEREFKEKIGKGDKIVTIGGLHGKIVEVNDKTFIIDVENGVKLKIEKTAIAMDATKALEKQA